MSSSEDVKTLYRRFGGKPDSYQEVLREKQAGDSLVKWAMLGQVNLAQGQEVPSVHRAVRTSATRPYSENLAELAAEQQHAAEQAMAQAMAQKQAAEEAAQRLGAQLESQRAAAEAAAREAGAREQAAQLAARELAARELAATQAEAAARAAQMAAAAAAQAPVMPHVPPMPAPYVVSPVIMAAPPAQAFAVPQPVLPRAALPEPAAHVAPPPAYASGLRRVAAAAEPATATPAGSLQNLFGRIAGGQAKPQGLSALKRKYQK